MLDKSGLNDRTFGISSMTNPRTYSFICNLNTGVSRWSANAVEYFGLAGEYTDNAAEEWKSHIFPDDMPAYSEAYNRIISREVMSQDFEYRVKNRQGNYVLVTCRSIISEGHDGEPDLFAGTIINHGIEDAIDATTALHGDSTFLSCIQNILNNHGSAAILKIGIEQFAHLNILYGFKMGNAVLKKFAEILSDAIKDKGMAFRLSGSKFAIILYGNYSIDTIRNCYEQLRDKLRYHFSIDGKNLPISVCGGAFFVTPGYAGSGIEIRSCLTYAISLSKEERHGDIVFFDENDSFYGKRFRMLSIIHKDIIEGCKGFYMVYQPLIDVKTGRVAGAEALVRWQNKEYGNVSPGLFIPWLETDSVFYELGLWILRTSLNEMKVLSQKYPELILNINITASQLERDEFKKDAMDIISQSGFNREKIILELTERCRQLDYNILADTIDFFHEQGIRMSLDDFGTGSSALNLLRVLPIDELKLDMSFVRNIEHSTTDQVLVVNILNVAGQMNIKTCVEGVETKGIADFLKSENVTYYQGYYYSKPIKIADFADYAESNFSNTEKAPGED